MLAEFNVPTVDLDRESAKAYDRLNRTLAEIAEADPSSLPLLRQQVVRDPEVGLHPLLFYDLMRGLQDDLSQSGENNHTTGPVLRSAALFHDLGKPFISPVSVEESLRIMSWVPEGEGNGNLQEDKRTPAIREAQRRHPYLSGLVTMPLLLGNDRMTQMDGAQALEIVVNHHSNRVHGDLITGRGTPLDSYPADPYTPSDEKVAWMRLFFELSDTAMGMAEPRGYRGGVSLDTETITEELINRIPISRMAKYHSNGYSPELVGQVVIPSIVGRTEELRPVILLMNNFDAGRLEWPIPAGEGEGRLLDVIHNKLWGHQTDYPGKSTNL